jgi:hypothetical protein
MIFVPKPKLVVRRDKEGNYNSKWSGYYNQNANPNGPMDFARVSEYDTEQGPLYRSRRKEAEHFSRKQGLRKLVLKFED